MKFIDEVPDNFWAQKRVLLRVGFDMGKEFDSMEGFRIQLGLDTIRFLLERYAHVILLNHNGRPQGKLVGELSNEKIVKRLSSLLNHPIPLYPLSVDPSTVSRPLAFLENLRFDPGEEADDPAFAKKLASFGQYYVNDAFSNSHRVHASMVSLARLLPHFGGLQLKRELLVLNQVCSNPLHPLLLIMGGTKGETKIKIVKEFWNKAQAFILGGVLANTFLHLKGIAVGKSMIEEGQTFDIRELPLTDTRLHLPVDVRVAKDLEGTHGIRISSVGKLAKDEIILDIGPDSEILFDNIIKSAKMIIWNGPMGKFERESFSHGTRALITSLRRSGADVITGGGETVEFLEKEGALDAFSFVSTGGGAMLSFLAGKQMPALEALD